MTTTSHSTPPRRTRAEAKAQTRKTVLAAAETVFRRDGFHGASLDQVAREAGFTKGAVYSTFDSKADLFLALLDSRSAERLSDIERITSAASDPADFVRRHAAHFAASVRRETDWWAVVLEFASVVARDPALRARYAEHHDRTREVIAVGVERWAADAGIDPVIRPRAFATTILAISNGLTLERLLAPEDVSDELYVESQLALLERAIPGATS